jgi:hypothetical protein
MFKLFMAPAVVLCGWWFVSESAYVGLKPGQYWCDARLSDDFGVVVRDPRGSFAAQVDGNEVVSVRRLQVSPDAIRYGDVVERPSVIARKGRDEFRTTIAKFDVVCVFYT